MTSGSDSSVFWRKLEIAAQQDHGIFGGRTERMAKHGANAEIGGVLDQGEAGLAAEALTEQLRAAVNAAVVDDLDVDLAQAGCFERRQGSADNLANGAPLVVAHDAHDDAADRRGRNGGGCVHGW